MWVKIQWSGEQHLSKAGKEVMSKYALQSISTYVVGCFKLPDYLIRELESIIFKFLCGDGTSPQNSSYTWKSIHSALDLVNSGIVWRIDGGTRVDV